jgi:hypothetical protein
MPSAMPLIRSSDATMKSSSIASPSPSCDCRPQSATPPSSAAPPSPATPPSSAPRGVPRTPEPTAASPLPQHYGMTALPLHPQCAPPAPTVRRPGAAWHCERNADLQGGADDALAPPEHLRARASAAVSERRRLRASQSASTAGPETANGQQGGWRGGTCRQQGRAGPGQQRHTVDYGCRRLLPCPRSSGWMAASSPHPLCARTFARACAGIPRARRARSPGRWRRRWTRCTPEAAAGSGPCPAPRCTCAAAAAAAHLRPQPPGPARPAAPCQASNLEQLPRRRRVSGRVCPPRLRATR